MSLYYLLSPLVHDTRYNGKIDISRVLQEKYMKETHASIADIYSIFAMSLRLLSQLLLSSLPIMLFTTYSRLQLHLYNLPRELLSRFSNMKYCSNALHYSTRTLTSRVSLLLVRATLLLSPDLLFRVPACVWHSLMPHALYFYILISHHYSICHLRDHNL